MHLGEVKLPQTAQPVRWWVELECAVRTTPVFVPRGCSVAQVSQAPSLVQQHL